MKRLVLLFITISLTLLVYSPGVFAQSVEDLQKRINDLQEKLAGAQSQEKTLTSEIARINNQISLTQLQIEAAEVKINQLTVKIDELSKKINVLETSLEHASKVLANRIVKTYIAGRDDKVFYLLASDNFQDFLQRFEYLRLAQKSDRELMLRMAASKKNYSDQKNDLQAIKKEKEDLSAKLKVLRSELSRQNKEKQSLLEVTRNDEKQYQKLITQAQAELEALRTSQFTGKRDVKKGEVIGLMGSTGFSTGPHLHFGVYNLSESEANSFSYNSGSNNPESYLKSRSLDVQSGACYDRSGTTMVGSGDKDWPMSNPKISQCYGKTPYSFVYANGLHEGLDMYDNNDIVIRADDDGVAYFYRGSTSFGNNVRIFHSNGKMTLFLHLQ